GERPPTSPTWAVCRARWPRCAMRGSGRTWWRCRSIFDMRAIEAWAVACVSSASAFRHVGDRVSMIAGVRHCCGASARYERRAAAIGGELRFERDLVRALLREQHPDLADLELRDVDGGWDNQQWRLGDDLAVRLPRTERAPALLHIERTWLPLL